MLLTVLLAAIHFTQAAAAAPPTAPPAAVGGFGFRKDCRRPELHLTKEPLRPRRFNELPTARLELAVIREVNGCPIPAVVQEGFGGRPLPRD